METINQTLIEQRDILKGELEDNYRPTLLNFALWLERMGYITHQTVEYPAIVETFISTKRFL